MIYNNPFQRMLLNDVNANKAIMVSERILCLYFPVDLHPLGFYEQMMGFIAAGMPPSVTDEEWDQEACDLFCSANGLLSWKKEGEVLFVLANGQP
jgi:hypothetical protein